MVAQQPRYKHNPVFWISAIATIIISAFAILVPDSFTVLANSMMTALKGNFSWLYLWAVLGFVIFAVVIAVLPVGKIRLGGDDEKPTLPTGSWIAMLFAAGMGIGMVFWGVSEPLSHYIAPMAGVDALTQEAQDFSMRSTFMHWGLHPWAIYSVVGMSMAYFGYRKHKRMLVSRTLHPLLGKSWSGPFGIVIDSYTAFLTVIGVATSFGMGCLQINSGLELLFGIPNGPVTWLLLIAVICVIYLLGSLTGVQKGMKWLSDGNMVLCIVLVVLSFICGSQIDTIKIWFTGLVDYVANFFPDSVRLSSEGDSSWIQSWRVFYWAWWVSWAPFVGVFLARISRGRTIREFVIGAMLVPTLISTVWFSVLGELGFGVADLFSAEELATMVGAPETALFLIFDKYPLGLILSIIAILLLFTFFITSASSATFVLGMQTSSGDQNPPVSKQLFWGILMAVVSFALIYSGGVSGIQTIAIVISFPFMFVMIAMCVSMAKDLMIDKKYGPVGADVIDDAGLGDEVPPKFKTGKMPRVEVGGDAQKDASAK